MKKLFLTLSLLVVFAVGAFAYIGNMRSSIFHYDNCHYVDRMSERNKIYLNTRQEAISEGYRPCKVCRP